MRQKMRETPTEGQPALPSTAEKVPGNAADSEERIAATAQEEKEIARLADRLHANA